MILSNKSLTIFFRLFVRIIVICYIGQAFAAQQEPVDKYQWMENNKEQTINWLLSRSQQSEKILNALPWQSKIKQQLDSLSSNFNSQNACDNVDETGNCFYFSWTKDFPYNRLFMKISDGKETLLVDPPIGYGIRYFIPSYDKKYVAYALFKIGLETVTIKIIRVKDKKILQDTIANLYFPNVSWSKNSRSLFYTRKSINSTKLEETYAKIYRHDVGNKVTDDTIIFDKKNTPNLASKYDAYLYFNAKWAIVTVSPGISGYPGDFYLSRYDNLNNNNANWLKIIDINEQVEDYYINNDWLYLAKYNAFSGYTISRMNLNDLNKSEEKIIEWKNGPLARWDLINDNLFIAYNESGTQRFKWVSLFNISDVKDVAVPYDGKISNINFNSTKKTISYELENWLTPPKSFVYHFGTQILKESTSAKSKIDLFSNYESEMKWVKSSNNVLVPLTILHHKGIKLDGTSPTWLTTYGAYGEITDPFFDSSRLVWLEHGGIIAIAHVRGGGELGPAWHAGGSRPNKENSVIDFIHCAEYLINNKYTNPSKLVISGRSAGGITIGMAIAKRPELFAAAAIDAGMLNTSKLDKIPIGAMNFLEFGSPFDKHEKKQLDKIDAYLNLRDGVKYPAILLSVGLADERISIWQTAKFAARLEEIKKNLENKNSFLVLAFQKTGHFFNNTSNIINFFIGNTQSVN